MSVDLQLRDCSKLSVISGNLKPKLQTKFTILYKTCQKVFPT